MSQKSILAFLKPSSSSLNQKRKSVEDSSGIQDSVPYKKHCGEVTGDKDTLLISEEKTLCERADENRWNAKIKLQAKRTPALSTNIGVSWFKALEQEFKQPYFMEISSNLNKENGTVYPPLDKVYTWTHLCDIHDVKVVIIGQDPYHGTGQAHGLAFSVPVGITIPPSLKNIYKAIKEDIPDFTPPNHGYLKGWAVQGVLLLNATLTVKAHNPNSHKDWKWTTFTDAVIKWINFNLKNVVFLLWGSFAKQKADLVDAKKHAIFTAPHPSPFSARYGFFDCHHFTKTNNYLVEHGKSPIDWSYLPAK